MQHAIGLDGYRDAIEMTGGAAKERESIKAHVSPALARWATFVAAPTRTGTVNWQFLSQLEKGRSALAPRAVPALASVTAAARGDLRASPRCSAFVFEWRAVSAVRLKCAEEAHSGARRPKYPCQAEPRWISRVC